MRQGNGELDTHVKEVTGEDSCSASEMLQVDNSLVGGCAEENWDANELGTHRSEQADMDIESEGDDVDDQDVGDESMLAMHEPSAQKL